MRQARFRQLVDVVEPLYRAEGKAAALAVAKVLARESLWPSRLSNWLRRTLRLKWYCLGFPVYPGPCRWQRTHIGWKLNQDGTASPRGFWWHVDGENSDGARLVVLCTAEGARQLMRSRWETRPSWAWSAFQRLREGTT